MGAIEINDAIHKIITLSNEEKKIVDHPYVQRLRFIKQLGFVSFVYPSATHDRFSHSLGTLHVASKFAQQIFYNDGSSILASLLSQKEKEFLTRMVRLAGLLHDIGHAPFSHAAEGVMPDVRLLDIPNHWLRNQKEKRSASHEDYSVSMLAGMTQGREAVLSEDEAQLIASLIHHKKINIPNSFQKLFSKKIRGDGLHAIVRSMVSSNIDADRMDYLLRDSHFTGVAYGQYDVNWLIGNLGVVEQNGRYIMSISDSGIHALEHYLFARYHMYVQVYLHKTVKCFEYYFRQSLHEHETSYSIPYDREAYASFRDSTLLESIFLAAKEYPNSWASLLLRRRPSKRIARIWGARKEAEKLLQNLKKDLAPQGITPFLYLNGTKFLDFSAGEESQKGKHGSLLLGLAAMPMVVIHKELGIVSSAPLADHSFILKQYHRDISIGDIYIRPDELEGREKIVLGVIKKYRTFGPSEEILREEL